MALEIIGPGFGRTGTYSLKIALEHLGFGPCHHMFEVRDHPEQLPAWEAAARGERVEWDGVFKGYRAQVDWPGARYWRELARHYPDAKVILTVRDPDDWFASVQATLAPLVAARGTLAIAASQRRGRDGLPDGRGCSSSIAGCRTGITPSGCSWSTSPRCRPRSPPTACSPSTAREGWGPLCGFLGVAVPDMAFPWTNSSKEFVAEGWKQ